MNIKKLLLTLTLGLIAIAIPAQSQTWFKVASDANPDFVVASGVTWRFGSPGCTTSTPGFSSQSTAAINSYISVGTNGFLLADPCPYFSKELDVLETAVAQTVKVNGVAVTVPALPPPPPPPTTTYPPIAFTPNVSYTFSIQNIPPASSSSPLAGLLVIQIGDEMVPLTCTYKTTLATPTSQSAVFTCIPLSPPVNSQ